MVGKEGGMWSCPLRQSKGILPFSISIRGCRGKIGESQLEERPSSLQYRSGNRVSVVS